VNPRPSCGSTNATEGSVAGLDAKVRCSQSGSAGDGTSGGPSFTCVLAL
jgi:hypothetical protein